MKFSVVYWPARKRLGISINEFAFMDVVRFLADNERGYCYASREKLAEITGLTKRTIINIVDRLDRKGLLAKTGSGKLYPTMKWKQNYNSEGGEIISLFGEKISPQEVKKLHRNGENISPEMVKNIHSGGEKTSPINKELNKDINKELNLTKDWNSIKDFYKQKLDTLMNGKTPDYKWAMFTNIVRPILEERGREETFRILKAFFNDAWIKKTGYKLTMLKSDINRFIGISEYDPKVGLGTDEWDAKNKAAYDEMMEKEKNAEMQNMPETI